MVKMRKPKSHETATWVLGINVEGKDVVDVPEGLVKDFKAMGYKVVRIKAKEGDDGKEEVDARSETQEGGSS